MATPTTAVGLAQSLTLSQMTGAALIVIAGLLSVLWVLYAAGLILQRFYPSLFQPKPERRVDVEPRWDNKTGKKYYVAKRG